MTTTSQAEGIVERLRACPARPEFDEIDEAIYVIERQQKEIEALRNRTIEECAKVADAVENDPESYAGEQFTARNLAKSIRALSSGGKE